LEQDAAVERPSRKRLKLNDNEVGVRGSSGVRGLFLDLATVKEIGLIK
jgi:hypothetical protein